jgi:hypothetical protein
VDSVEGVTPSVAEPEPITAFFARYTGYLTAGDLDGLANIYNYPVWPLPLRDVSPSLSLSRSHTSRPAERDPRLSRMTAASVDRRRWARLLSDRHLAAVRSVVFSIGCSPQVSGSRGT